MFYYSGAKQTKRQCLSFAWQAFNIVIYHKKMQAYFLALDQLLRPSLFVLSSKTLYLHNSISIACDKSIFGASLLIGLSCKHIQQLSKMPWYLPIKYVPLMEKTGQQCLKASTH